MANPPEPQEPRPGAAARRTRRMGKEEFAVAFAAWESQIREALRAGQDGEPRAGRAGDERAGAPARGVSPAWALVGIKRRGAVIARRLWKALSTKDRPLLYGEIDISLYRDDYHLKREKPVVLGTEISFPVEGVRVLLVDDVLYTGRTVRAAMDLILDFGRPRAVLLAVFIDRGHRELPIASNFTGRVIPTAPDDQVLVTLQEMGEEDGVDLIQGGG
ncbi:MAG: bifunctional pyr operon transcriptional regulator/uracil phosphoribosyltransferase PyrR [Planctomycetes bacterium]|nr:bifunctional pyr operon transcriptional regulator/uracil phosphoribosyltransferase PyrR [Planctomycetota bacterium]